MPVLSHFFLFPLSTEHFAYTVSTEYHSGGAGSFGTTADYLQILVALINEGKGANGAQILRPDTVREMYRDQIEHLPGALDKTIPGARADLSTDVQIMPG
jgi:methyl acetate hydrolase